MFNIVLFQPEIPPNTGNIIRLCANTGSTLHLIHPLGFTLTEKQFRRAGLDYHDLMSLHEYKNFDDFIATQKPKRLFAIETSGTRNYDEINYQPGDFLFFGKETKGISKEILDSLPQENILKIPMQPSNRSINLSNTVAIVTYEAWRQNSFKTN